MRAYGAKRNNWDYFWTGKEEILVPTDYKFSNKRARRENKKSINTALDEMMVNQDLDDLDRLAQTYGDYDLCDDI